MTNVADLPAALEALRKGSPLVRVCAWCQRAFLGGRWVEVDRPWPVEVLRTHGMCPDCAERQGQELEEAER